MDFIWNYPTHLKNLFRSILLLTRKFKPFGYICIYIILVALTFYLGIKVNIYSKIQAYQGRTDKTLNIGFLDDNPNLSTNIAANSISAIYDRLVYSKLVTINPSGSVNPQLAKSIDVNSTQTSYTFNLRDNVYWSNGKQFDASDVIYTYEKIRSDKSINFPSSISISSVGQYTVIFTLTAIDPTFWEDISYNIIPNPKHQSGDQIIGTGPYVLMNYGSNYINLTRNTKYFEGDPKITNINIYTFKTVTSLQSSYDKYNLSIVFTNTNDLNNLNAFDIKTYNITSEYSGLFFNIQSNGIQKDVNNRQQLYNALVPIEQLKSPISKYSFAYFPDNTVSTAKNIPGQITLTYLDSDYDSIIANQVKLYWSKIGVITILNPLSINKMEDAIKSRNYQAILTTVQTGTTPYQYVFWDSHETDYPGINLSMLSNGRVDQFLTLAGLTSNQDIQKNAYILIQQTLYTQYPAVYIQNPSVSCYYQNSIVGLNNNPIVYPQDIFNNIQDWYFDYK